MSTVANALSASGSWLFPLLMVAMLMSVAYGLFINQESGITTRERDDFKARDYHEMGQRGTR